MAQRSIFEVQADLCRCMSNAVRIEIVHILRDGPQRVSELVQLTGQTQSVVSRHLGVLRNGGVVMAHRHAQDVIYQIANPKIVNICNLMREVLMEDAQHRNKLVEGFLDESAG